MPIDIIEQIKQDIGNAAVPKIDPNTQEPLELEKITPDIESASIPVVLAGYYKSTRNEEDAAMLINKNAEGVLNQLFGEQTDQITKSIADYSKTDTDVAKSAMERTAASVKKFLQKNIKDLNGLQVMNFFTDQRSNILKHLPVEMHIGELLNDSTMDDKTNKMEGPMSGLMHGIEKLFSSSK